MLLEKAKQVKDGVVLAGDGRHDSMGHSAKFCACTIFCCTFAQIIHFNLVQVGRKKCLIIMMIIIIVIIIIDSPTNYLLLN